MRFIANSLIIALLLWSADAQAQKDKDLSAPFGLRWGQSLAEVKRATASTPTGELLWGRVYSLQVHKTPITPDNTDAIYLAVDPDLGLGRVTWFGNDITHDVFGTSGKRHYGEFKRLLTEKYGRPRESFEQAGLRVYNGPDEFYQCLKYDGCGSWATIWTSPKYGTISLVLKGRSRGTGFIIITYEGPNWKTIIEKVNAQESSKAKKAF